MNQIWFRHNCLAVIMADRRNSGRVCPALTKVNTVQVRTLEKLAYTELDRTFTAHQNCGVKYFLLFNTYKLGHTCRCDSFIYGKVFTKINIISPYSLFLGYRPFKCKKAEWFIPTDTSSSSRPQQAKKYKLVFPSYKAKCTLIRKTVKFVGYLV